MSIGSVLKLLKPQDLSTYQAHLLRLDRKSRWSRFNYVAGDAAIHAHCDRLRTNGGLVLGAYTGELMRGAAEITKTDRADEGDVELAFSVEREFQHCGIGARLLAQALKLAEPARAVLVCRPDNTDMLQLTSRFGARVSYAGDQLVCVIATSPVHSIRPAGPSKSHFEPEFTDFACGYV